MATTELTEKQIGYLNELANGAADLPVRPSSTLRDMGLVEKTEATSRGRGYVNVRLTDAGRDAIA